MSTVINGGLASATCVTSREAAPSAPSPSYRRKIGSRLAPAASISCRRPATGPGMTSSWGSTAPASSGVSRSAPISPRWITSPPRGACS